MYIIHRKNVHLRHTYWFDLSPAARRRQRDREETQYRSHRCTFSLRNTYIFATRHLDRRPRISLSVSSARFVFVKVLISPGKRTSTTWILIFLPARVTTTAEICRNKITQKRLPRENCNSRGPKRPRGHRASQTSQASRKGSGIHGVVKIRKIRKIRKLEICPAAKHVSRKLEKLEN